MSRYNRHIIMPEIGPKGQEKLAKAKVLVIGAGGLGCPVLQYLAAAGIGTIGIVDFDVVEISNLQRQVLFGTSDVGKNKALAAKEHLLDLNNTIQIETYPYQLTYQNALNLFRQYDIVVDGSDNFPTRYLVNDACILTEKPLVYGAIFKFEGQVAVFNYNNGPSYRCLFPEPPKDGSVPNCSDIGVLGVLPGIIGSMQANEVLKIILGLGSVISGSLLLYNALTAQTTTISINRSESQFEKVLSQRDAFQKKEMKNLCETSTFEVDIKDISSYRNIQFIDVREMHEEPKVDLDGAIQLPMSILESRLNEIDANGTKILFCASGIRSLKAATLLQQHGISHAYSLKDGVQALITHQKNKEHERA
ncbi:HesA/MoeB/ThiF family protein [Aureisphaera galaxeae]|uniref:HesA/MoeB/ThiF family protein n=1 Tax=Aureisphaera galaxeae TaxID=1538023 RepID=UPI002350756F|nr:HesA/MoeB/ThiF family protein [Aureisphaera galaxeae]MDC8002475.1 HesA/MoeB/ThiF family protein [Aureisphaera galaxeae]